MALGEGRGSPWDSDDFPGILMTFQGYGDLDAESGSGCGCLRWVTKSMSCMHYMVSREASWRRKPGARTGVDMIRDNVVQTAVCI